MAIPFSDAAMLSAAQAVEHYEITRYGTLITFAQQLSRGDVAPVLQQTLQEEKNTDQPSAWRSLFNLAGCTQPEPIVLRNPVTGEVRQCRATVSAFVFPIAATAETSPAVRQCVTAYEAAGWWRLN